MSAPGNAAPGLARRGEPRPLAVPARILVTDDDDHLREVVRYALAREGFEVIEACDGEEALARIERDAPDLVVLDVNMPRLDGFSLCRRVREHSEVPILMLSSRTDEVDRVLGLDLGGDDYLTKPFSTRELVSRVKARLRRHRGLPEPDDELRWGRLRLSPGRHRAWVDAHELSLTATEHRMLAALMRHPQRVLGREQLASQAYPDGRQVSERTVDSHVRRIRAKLRPHAPRAIETVHGIGFRLGAPP
ncbi:MAG: response regulator transcription factor [Myxococcales bacterium]|nr:response regulator transcription factor [Myxococcales bacterium]